MSTQMLNEQTFSTGAVARERSTTTTSTMSVLGVSIKTLFFLVVALAFGAVGWRNASDVVGSTSVLWFLLGYIALIALTIMTGTCLSGGIRLR